MDPLPAKGCRLRELPRGERPRERLLRHGPGALSNAELLAILLRIGDASTGRSALDLAREILALGARRGGDESGLGFLVTAAVEELTGVKGIGFAKAVQLKAAVELGRRVAAASRARQTVTSPAEAHELLMEEMRHLDREEFRTILLDTKSGVISVEVVSIGTLSSAPVHPREIFKMAVRKNAAALILAHNHPSGDPTPTAEDVGVTRRLAEAGRVLGIEVLDHLVIGDNRYISFRERGIAF